MAADKAYSVAILGLTNHEERFIKIMMAFTSHTASSRTEGKYRWTAEAADADIVIVNAEDAVAMRKWHEISVAHPSVSLLLITATDNPPLSRHFCVRPISPARTLEMLDRIVEEFKLRVTEQDVFAGAAMPPRKAADLTVSTIVPVRMRALVVDDSPTVRKKLLLELGNFNIKTDTAESGELGLEMLGENAYDIVFLDIVLPGQDGFQVCKTIRRNPATRNTPVIMLSSKSSRFDKVRGSIAGCNAYLSKPVEYEEFYRVLEDYLAIPAGKFGESHKLA